MKAWDHALQELVDPVKYEIKNDVDNLITSSPEEKLTKYQQSPGNMPKDAYVDKFTIVPVEKTPAVKMDSLD